MKETDNETSVIWPSWCYSGKINCNVLKEYSEIENDFQERNSIYSSSTRLCSETPSPLSTPEQLSLPTNEIVGENKMLSERSLLLSGYVSGNTINSVKTTCDKNNTPTLAGVPLAVQGTGRTITPTTTAAAAAAYLYLEKVKNERMSPRVTAAQLDSLKDAIMESSAAAAVAAAMVNNNNNTSINNNNNHSNNSNNNNNSSVSGSTCSSSSSTISINLLNSQAQNQIANNSNNNTSDELHSHSLIQSCNQSQQQQQQQQHHQHQKQSHHQQQQQQQQQLSIHMNSNHVKKERLSPGTNGDHQTPLTRSRSTTPSSFRGTSPQNSAHISPSETLVPMHNLSTNLLTSIQQANASNRHVNLSVSSPGTSSGVPSDFSTRNYSDFMRSLAAKYNNTNPNDNLKRNALLETTSNIITAQKKTSGSAQKTSYATSPSTPLNKEVTITTTSSLPPPAPMISIPISPRESTTKLSQQNKLAEAVANAAAACSTNVSPYMTSFLSSLPFSPGIFPPLIDMSSTQALITLARAAKENEIHNILNASSQHSKRSTARLSPSPSPSLNMALQQAAQFISPALIYSAQLQKQQLQQHQQQQQQVASQSSPHLANISNSNTSSTTSAKSSKNHGAKVHVWPLDLSSQPPAAKRVKAESTSSQSSGDGVIHTAIARRTSSSTSTTSPSPPPLNEKSLNASAIPIPTPAITPSAFVGSSSKTEATLTAFTPIKVASSTSAPSSIAPAAITRQCQAQSEELNSWTVDDVCAFVGSIDICAEYVKHFRDQCIDGSGLPLLTEDHLVNSLGMKLGPALKLRSMLAKKLGGPCPCVSCVSQVQQVLALQTSGMTAATAATASDHITGNNATSISPIVGNSGSCNSHLPKNSLLSNSSMNCSSHNSNINSPVNKNESNTNNTTTNVCSNDGNTSNTIRSNINANTNASNFSSPPQLLPATTIEQQHQQQQQQKSPSPSTNRHDNTDCSSTSTNALP